MFQVFRSGWYAWRKRRGILSLCQQRRAQCARAVRDAFGQAKQRLPVRNPAPLATPERLNQCWSVDFMHDALVCGRRFRTFNVVDDFNREVLAIKIDLNVPAQRVVRVAG